MAKRGRPKKYADSTTKTSEAHKIAIKTYRQKNSLKNICLTLPSDEIQQDKKLLAEHGLTFVEFWRKAIEQLKNDDSI